jgi:flavin reductase (DIM6/NTAB) family NADH-FMN oxidoreductase RutF
MTQVSESISAADLRHALGHFASGVTVITSVAPGGEPVGTTVSAVSSVSLDPPLVLVCLDRTSQTLAAIRAHRAFSVNVLANGQEQLSNNFARRGSAVDWRRVAHRAGRDGSPRLDGVLATFDCRLVQRVDGGDHEILLGRIDELEVSDETCPPLVHFRGMYASLTSA